jgi:signal transduction histidine kinase
MESVGQLAAGIAHEINTPIQFIGDNLRFLEEIQEEVLEIISEYKSISGQLTGVKPQDGELKLHRKIDEEEVYYIENEIPKAICQSLDGIQRVSNIVQALKEFSHPGSNEKVKTDLNKAILNTLTVAQNQIKHVADIETNLDPDLPSALCIPSEINQALLNLIVNAAHAIEDLGDISRKGKITVSTRYINGMAEISIADTGAGIPENCRNRVFDPFYTTKKLGRGTGQGLTITRNIIVKKHNGAIDFESTPGKGATFTVQLPICEELDKQLAA